MPLQTVAKYARASTCQPPSVLSAMGTTVPSPPVMPWYLLCLRVRALVRMDAGQRSTLFMQAIDVSGFAKVTSRKSDARPLLLGAHVARRLDDGVTCGAA